MHLHCEKSKKYFMIENPDLMGLLFLYIPYNQSRLVLLVMHATNGVKNYKTRSSNPTSPADDPSPDISPPLHTLRQNLKSTIASSRVMTDSWSWPRMDSGINSLTKK